MNAYKRIISMDDGRWISLIEAGQPDGIPVLGLNGTPGSSLLYNPWIEDARSRGIRLISYDRPGYGGSTPKSGRKITDAADDVTAIAKELKLDRLFIWGFSGGAAHALACAALLPDLVMAAASLASLAPIEADGLDYFAGMDEDNVVEVRAALEGYEALKQLVEASTPGIMSAEPGPTAEALRTHLCPADITVLAGDFGSYQINCMCEGIKEIRDGWIDDDLAFVNPWGFELNQIRIPFLLMQGEQDRLVPFSHGKWLSNKIPNVTARFFADDGHLSLVANHIPEVHDWLMSNRRDIISL